MTSCDVAIVGGGPAGSSCAWGLRHTNLKVAILDKETFPRDKICGGWITPGVLSILGIDSAAYSQRRVLQPITGFRVGSIGGRAVETHYDRVVSYGIRRCEFDEFLIRRSGAELLSGFPLRSLERAGSRWMLNGQVETPVVVGAGGHFCPVARMAGAEVSAEDAVVAQETEFEMNAEQVARCSIGRETPELYFCPDMKGYGWCFRKGNFLNVGLGRLDRHRLSAYVSEFLDFLKSAGRVCFELPRMHGHAYLLHSTSTRKVADEGMLLTGDAAGLAYAQSGEGIRPAIESGLLAAETIIAGNGKLEGQGIERYRKAIAGPGDTMLSNIGRHIPSQMVQFLARNLLEKRWFVREILLNGWFLRLSSNPSSS